VYVGNYAGALEAIHAGVTTILDFSHCNNTPEHADAAIQGLCDAGLRAVFAYGYFAPPRPEPYFTAHEQRLADSRRVAQQLSGGDRLVTMGISRTEPGLIPFEDTRADRRQRRDHLPRTRPHTPGCGHR
jgi:cytosine/adenosine deaminase-related metal-dependent hydrolase